MIEVRYDTKHWNAIQKIVNLPSFIFFSKKMVSMILSWRAIEVEMKIFCWLAWNIFKCNHFLIFCPFNSISPKSTDNVIPFKHKVSPICNIFSIKTIELFRIIKRNLNWPNKIKVNRIYFKFMWLSRISYYIHERAIDIYLS